ncbi:MAG: hypothetical protein ACLPX5_12330, partial [Dissulfurispiraceae bacterium]
MDLPDIKTLEDVRTYFRDQKHWEEAPKNIAIIGDEKYGLEIADALLCDGIFHRVDITLEQYRSSLVNTTLSIYKLYEHES